MRPATGEFCPLSKAVLIFAMRGLIRRPLQTVLLLFALSIALAATMTIMAVISGIREQMRRDLEQIGLDVINVHASPSVKNLMTSPLRFSDCDWMQETSGGIVAPFFATMGVATVDGEPPAQTLLLQTTAAWGQIVPLQLIEGRFFEADERDVGVLDEWVAKKLFPDGPATGRTLRVKRLGLTQTIRVVGVMKDPFEIRKKFEELDVTGSARSRILRMMEFKSIYVSGSFTRPDQTIHGAVIKIPAGRDPLLEEEMLGAQARQRWDRSVWVWARKRWIGNVLEAADFGTQVANIIWIVVLVVTGVMIMTVSLVAIRERFREIAIRRTEGARRGQIVGQLLSENLLLSAEAGLAALGLSRWASSMLEKHFLSWPPAFLTTDLALALCSGMILGALATVMPARHAAALDPVEVLRES